MSNLTRKVSAPSIDADLTVIDMAEADDVITPTPLAQDPNPNAQNYDVEGYSTPTQLDSQVSQSTLHAFIRRYTRASWLLSEWWKALALSAQYFVDAAFSARVVPTSYNEAKSPANIEVWDRGIAR